MDVRSGLNTKINNDTNQYSRTKSEVLYTVQESPPWYLCILFGFQHFLTASGSLISLPFLLSKCYCMDNDYVALSEILGTVFFVSGVVTFLQTTFGVRLPILQGTSAGVLTSVISIMNQPKWKCPYTEARHTYGANVTFSDVGLPDVGSTGHQEIWHQRIREIQGALIIAALIQMVIGFTGVMGFAVRYFGPLVLTPTVTLTGLSLFQTGAEMASQHWWIAFMTIMLVTIFSQHFKNAKLPCFSCGNENSETSHRLPVFTLFPVMFATLISWGISGILTATGALPENPGKWGYAARTDRGSEVLRNAQWFRFPYPGQWGLPTVTVASVFGVLAGCLASMLKSYGDYYASAKVSGAPTPPPYAINRGIVAEGFGNLLNGIWGTGQGTSSFAQNIGTIGITKVGSRLVFQVAACIMIVLGCLGKFSALFASIPQPIVGGLFMVTFGMITGVGLSNLQYVDLNSHRNIFIIGLSIFFGISIPFWIKQNPNAINTGTLEERGIIALLEDDTTNTEKKLIRQNVYWLPYIQEKLNDISALMYFPICPTFSKARKTKNTSEEEQPVSDV